MLRIYGIKNCDTMKKSFAWLDENSITYEFVDYRKTDVVNGQLADWNRRVGWKSLLNTRGLTWKRLSDEERDKVDESKALALMIEYPSLIRRPVADNGKTLLIGFEPEIYSRELGAKNE